MGLLLSYMLVHYSYKWSCGFIFICVFLCLCSVWVQNRGFKTMKSKTRHLPSGFEGPVDAENYTPAFMKVSKLEWHWSQKYNRNIWMFCFLVFFLCLFFLYFLYPFLCSHQGLLMKEKRDMGNLEQLLKQNNLPESLQDAFKTGFTEGFMKAQALTQRTQGNAFRPS